MLLLNKEQSFQFRLIRKQIMSCYLGLIFWKPEIPQGTFAYFILACINSFYFFTWWQMSRSLWYFFFILRKLNQICTSSCYLCIKRNYIPILQRFHCRNIRYVYQIFQFGNLGKLQTSIFNKNNSLSMINVIGKRLSNLHKFHSFMLILCIISFCKLAQKLIK